MAHVYGLSKEETILEVRNLYCVHSYSIVYFRRANSLLAK